MTHQRIRIGTRQFVLDPAQDITALKLHIVRAVHGGGGFVSMLTAGNGTVEMLVTAHLSVWFEEMDAADGVYPVAVGDLASATSDEAQVDYDGYFSELPYAS